MAMRGPGETPGSFALETALDELAEKCGIDPIELRVRNEPEVGPVSGLPFAGRNLIACFREGARRFGWAQRDPRPGPRREGRRLLGTGTATCPAYVMSSTAAVTAEADGTFTVRINAIDVGTGARTAIVLVAADALQVDRTRGARLPIGGVGAGPAGLDGPGVPVSCRQWSSRSPSGCAGP